MTNKHVFNNHCVDFHQILCKNNLDDMLNVVYNQSKTELAKMRVDFANYKDYGTDEWSPAYFGQFTEWLAEHFLNHYGHLFNIQNIQMIDSEGSSEEDYGIDGRGISVKPQVMQSTGRKSKPGSPVYIQVKGTMNKTKEYTPNDGSRLPNFGLNALAEATVGGYSYQARYLIFTTGSGLHHSLEKMSKGLFEVINHKKIRLLMDKDTVFLNKLRASVGLIEYPVNLSEIDPESSIIKSEIVDIESKI